jgi:hypothetical protein
MSNEKDTKKANTPALGAEGAGASEGTIQKKVVVIPDGTPEWLAALLLGGQAIIITNEEAQELIVSNQAVVISNEELIASNQKVVESIELFKEKGGDMIKAIMDAAKGIPVDQSFNTKVKEKLEVNPDAKYIVAKGKKFQDRQNPGVHFTEGENVSKLDNSRLEILLNQGFIEEAPEVEDDND